MGNTRERWVAAVSAVALGVAAFAGCGDTGGEKSGGGGGGAGASGEFKRPITMVVPFGPGVGSDQAARLSAPVIEKEIGQEIPVVNVPGATGNTGMTKMLQGPPEQSLAIMPADTLATVVAGTSSFQLDEVAPVCRISNAPSSLWVNTKGKYKDWDALGKAAKENPGEVAVATVGKGGIDDIALGSLEQQGFKFRAVPFAEGSERKGAVLSGDTEAIFEQAGDVKENVDAGQFKPALLFADKKQEGLEGDYTLASDLGVEEFLDQWRGIFANSEMAPEQLKTLSDACSKVEQDPKFDEFRKKALEVEGGFMDSEEYGKFVKDEQTKIKDLGAKYGVFK